jgi:hypothetical protein
MLIQYFVLKWQELSILGYPHTGNISNLIECQGLVIIHFSNCNFVSAMFIFFSNCCYNWKYLPENVFELESLKCLKRKFNKWPKHPVHKKGLSEKKSASGSVNSSLDIMFHIRQTEQKKILLLKNSLVALIGALF